MKTTLLLILSAGLVSAQVFYTGEEFYRYIEHRARMAQIEKGTEVSTPTEGPEWDRFNQETRDWFAGRRNELPVPPSGWAIDNPNPEFWQR
jgi:hypothetical protein